MKSLFNNVVFATIIIAVAVILFIAVVPSSKAKAENAPLFSSNFKHLATEALTDYETIDIYTDIDSDITCYLYKNSNRSNLSCVKK
jgi:hypothetical protein